ncbi:MAG: 1-hydroxycarotenoid 3,4-desaturase CrtD [Bacteroidota bacterium]
MRETIVVGSGVAGLATAIRLQHAGNQVLVIEKNSTPGGKLGNSLKKGYRFDLGPSLFTLPHLVDELFLLTGKNPRDYYSYKQLGVSCAYFWEDGTKFAAPANVEDFAHQASRIFSESEAHILKYLSKSKLKYDRTSPIFLEKSLHKVSTYISKDAFKAICSAHSLGIGNTLHQLNKKSFTNKKLIQLFDRYATYNGSSPFLTPGIMSMIPYLELGVGTYFPIGGMYEITKALYKLAKDIGVRFKFDEKVVRIEVKDNTVHGVATINGFYEATRVVANSDIWPTYKNLLPKQKLPKKIKKHERSSSALIFYWGISKEFDQLEHHNIFFSNDYQSEFRHIFANRSVSSDPTIYINITSKSHRPDAPVGKENWFVMVNTSANYGQNWPALIQDVRKNIINKLERMLKVAVESHIETEFVLDPTEIERKTGSFRGALYGASSNSRFSAFLRQPNFHKSIKGLYFCGGSVHPGGGIPLCLHSAKIVSNLISENSK